MLHELKDLHNGHTFRHHVNFPHNGLKICVGIMLVKVHQFPDMDHPQDMVAVFFTKRITGVTGIMDNLQVFFQGIFHKQADHILPGNHDLPGNSVGKIKDIINQAAFYGIDFPAFFAVTDHPPNIIF